MADPSVAVVFRPANKGCASALIRDMEAAPEPTATRHSHLLLPTSGTEAFGYGRLRQEIERLHRLNKTNNYV